MILDSCRDAWRWVTHDLDSEDAAAEVTAVAEALTSHERALVAVTHVAFAVLGFALFLALPGAAVGTAILGVQATDHPAGLVGIVIAPAVWFVLRKPRALAKSAILRRIARRARGRAAGREVLDSAAASGAPVAVSVDVDHDGA